MIQLEYPANTILISYHFLVIIFLAISFSAVYVFQYHNIKKRRKMLMDFIEKEPNLKSVWGKRSDLKILKNLNVRELEKIYRDPKLLSEYLWEYRK